jgi:hypothetical protein
VAVQYWATGAVVVFGCAAFAVTLRWIAADRDPRVGYAVILGLQTLFIAAVLAAVRWRNGRRLRS